MKMNKMVITELHLDLLKIIMILVAKSSQGAADLARAISVCRVFMNVGADKDVLRAVNFGNVKLPNRYELFQYINGLLNKCAQAGNVTAQYMLAKTVLISSSQFFVINIPTDAQAGTYILDQASCSLVSVNHARSTFMAHFIADQASTSNTSNRRLFHPQLVRLFLCQCSPRDLVEMRPHLVKYFKYFTGFGRDAAPDGYLRLFENIGGMCTIVGVLRYFEKLSKEIRELEYPLQDLEDIPEESEKGKSVVSARYFGLGGKFDSYTEEYNKLHTLKELDGKSGESSQANGTLSDPRFEELKAAYNTVAAHFKSYRLGAISAYDRLFPPSCT